MLYFITSQLSINQSTSLYTSEQVILPTQSLFLNNPPSKITRSEDITSTETKTPAPSKPYYVTQTYFATKIKDIIDESKESLKEIFADQDAKFDRKSEKQLKPLSIRIK